MNLTDPLPALRPIDVVPVTAEDGQTQFLLHDQTGLAETTLAISLPGYFVLAHLDGRHSGADIQARFGRQFGAELPPDQLLNLVRVLDDALLLANERSEAAYDTAVSAYLQSPVRDNTARWPDAAALRTAVESVLAGPTSHTGPAPRGIIAPHLDYARGEPCYCEAYAALAACEPAERYIILGTNHFGRCASVVATTKHFRTPLGDAPVDVGFLNALESRLGESLCVGEFDHLREHSVELQVHILQLLNGDKPFQIVPILCPDPCGPSGMSPAVGGGPDLDNFADALAAELADSPIPTVLIAGADLSHVGQHFGDESPSTPEFLAQIDRWDQGLMQLIAARRDDEFVAAVSTNQNQTRICSVGCIFALLRSLPDRTCDVLRYHQAIDWAADTHVTCCAAVVY